MLGTGGAFLADRMGSSIARRVQVEQLGMSVLGVITHFDRDAKEKDGKNPDAVIEAFRGLRLTLVNETAATGPMVVTVTSPGSGDGKSFISSNLALAFAYAKQRTLLVDADLRRGALHRVLNLARQPGLTDLLVGDASRATVLQTTSYPCLDFLAGGSRRRDAPELLGSAAMADLVASLRSTYDIIVLDSAPLGAGVDALALAKLAGNLVMVLRLGRTDRELAEAKLEILRRLPLRLLGAVLNDVRDESEYGAYAYYMDGYGLTNEPLFRPLVARKPGAGTRVGG
jgi:capsular exopolysaccharide synthesis family protein